MLDRVGRTQWDRWPRSGDHVHQGAGISPLASGIEDKCDNFGNDSDEGVQWLARSEGGGTGYHHRIVSSLARWAHRFDGPEVLRIATPTCAQRLTDAFDRLTKGLGQQEESLCHHHIPTVREGKRTVHRHAPLAVPSGAAGTPSSHRSASILALPEASGTPLRSPQSTRPVVRVSGPRNRTYPCAGCGHSP